MPKLTHLFAIVTILFAYSFNAVVGADQTNKKRPNVLFIIVDDQSPFDLKAYNPDTICDTPNIDRLAVEGMTLDGAYHMGSFRDRKSVV